MSWHYLEFLEKLRVKRQYPRISDSHLINAGGTGSDIAVEITTFVVPCLCTTKNRPSVFLNEPQELIAGKAGSRQISLPH
jgi:hypothetical protein